MRFHVKPCISFVGMKKGHLAFLLIPLAFLEVTLFIRGVSPLT